MGGCMEGCVPFKTAGQMDMDLPIIYSTASLIVLSWNSKSATVLFNKLAKATGNKYSDIECIDESETSFLVVDGSYVPIHAEDTFLLQDLAIFVSSMTDDDEDAEIKLTHDAVMTYLIKHHAKELFVLNPCALFPTRTLWK
jgi:hypothetical protein